MNMNGIKVILIGLDGMTLRVLEPYMKANLMPNFSSLTKNGCCGILSSTIPSLTGPGWSSMATGKNPGKHGIYEFRRRNGYRTELVTRNTSPRAEPIWKTLSRNNKRVAVVNVPFTYPPDSVNGIMVSGMMTPDISSDFVFPGEFKKQLLKIIPDYRLDIYSGKFKITGRKDALVERVLQVTNDGRKLMRRLLDTHRWDFFFMTFVGPDRLQHFMWDEVVSMDPQCVRCYQLIDDIIGDVLNRMDERTILFVGSDHGFAPAKRVFFVNNFLRRLGLLQTRKNPAPQNTRAGIHDTILRIISRTGLSEAKKLLPVRLVSAVRRSLSKGSVMGHEVDRKISPEEIEWTGTKVFSLLTSGIISVNLKEREPEGTVPPDQYDSVCRYVEEALLRVEDPLYKAKMVKAVFRGSDIYDGAYESSGPDLVVVMNEPYSISERLGDSIVADSKLDDRYMTGVHDRYGIYAACGPVINNSRTNADICDIAPTILYLMNTPIPYDVDGRVLTEIITPDFAAENPVRFEQKVVSKDPETGRLGKAESDQIERQLKNLGYLD